MEKEIEGGSAFWSSRDLAGRYGLDLESVQRAAKRGALPAVRCGKEWRFSRQKIRELELSGRLW